MDFPVASRRPRSAAWWVRAVGVGCAGLAVVLAGLDLVGWSLDLRWLRWLGGDAGPAPHDAIAILAVMAALRLRMAADTGRRPLAVAAIGCAAVAIGIGAPALWGQLSDPAPAVAPLLFRDGPGTAAEAGGSLPASTALALMLLGGAVIALPVGTRGGHRPADWLALAGGLVGVFTLIAVPLGATSTHALSPYTTMALPTAVAIGAAGNAILLAYPDRGIAGVLGGQGPGASALRIVLPLAVIAPVTLEGLEVLGERLGLRQGNADSVFHLLFDVAILTTFVWLGARRLDRAEADRDAAERARADAEASARHALHLERVAQAALEALHPHEVAPAVAASVREQLGAERVTVEFDGAAPIATGPPLPASPRPTRRSAPLRVGQRRLGTLAVEHAAGRRFSEEEARLLQLLAVPGALAIDRARLAAAEQEALRGKADALERYRILTEMLPLMVWMSTPSGAMEFFNTRWCDYTGLTPEQSAGEGWTRALHADDVHAGFGGRNAFVQRSGEPLEYEVRLRRRDGAYRWHAGRCTAIRDDAGRVVRVLGTFTDVDDQRRLAEERAALLERERAARMSAEGASRAKDDFLGTLSHELRTPLTPILAWSDLLRSGTLTPEETRAALESIERSAHMQSRLIEDLLDVSAIVAGKLRLDPRPMDLAQSVQEALDSVRPAAAGKNITLDVTMERDTARLVGDTARLQQVAWNLLTNAVKFTPRGGRVGVTLHRDGDTAVLRVSDTGQGIPREFLPFVFHRFHQADSTPGRQHGGLGLGLAIVRHLTELHGGTVRVDSPGEGKGATFTVELPLPPVGEARGAIKPLAVAGESLDGLRVLLVDDDVATAEVLQTLLSLYGGDVQVAHSAAEALDLFERRPADVLVSDIGMPDCDGFELIRRLRSRGPARGGTVPAIALTAYARPEDRDAVLAAGFQLHLAKPVEPATLVAALADFRPADAAVDTRGDGGGPPRRASR